MIGSAIPMLSVLETGHDPYFVQRVKVDSQFAAMSRQLLLTQFLAGKRVLDIGHDDWPATGVNPNLQVVLDAVRAQLDGVDRHDEAAAAIRPLVKGQLFTSIEQVCGSYDETFFEVGHPNHNCWCTPDTFKNLVTKYTDRSITDTVWFLNGISLMLFADKEK
jgi:hypothetical protein